MNQPTYPDIAQQVEHANRIIIIQADNPDGDSLASALALEHILGDMGKGVSLWCGVDIPDYLKHLSGWDRVSKDMPSQFDLSIIVDTSALSLLEKLEDSHYRNWIAAKPVIVLDHHAGVDCDIPYASTVINDADSVATGELIYKLASQVYWSISIGAAECIMSSILSDSMGLTTEGTTATTYRIMSELVDIGANRTKLEEARRAFMKMPESILRYKAELIARTELHHDGTIATVTVPLSEILEHSPHYNPAALITPDLLMTEGVLVVIVLKIYDDRITGAIRCNNGGAIAAELAQQFNGGGHEYAAGFKLKTPKSNATEVKQQVITAARNLLESTRYR